MPSSDNFMLPKDLQGDVLTVGALPAPGRDFDKDLQKAVEHLDANLDDTFSPSK